MSTFLLAAVLSLAGALSTEDEAPNVSGGQLHPEQAAYDVLHYDLDLRVDPETRSIRGTLGLRAQVVADTDALLLHLDGRLDVSAVERDGAAAAFGHDGGRLRVRGPFAAEREVELVIRYGGTPRVATNPPWDGGFTWAETEDGQPWIATSNQGEGADLWWPCKDHPSDEADTMDISVTVPAPLVVATNGRLVEVREREGLRTYRWRVSTPINNYGVALNIAPYETITRDYESVAGDVFPVTYWVLPENLEKGRDLFEEILDHLRWFEETFGPYPFRADKYGVAETPHLGMEHQTIVAYGNRYRGNIFGPDDLLFDSLHHHELAHEWWGNMVTAESWEDMWIHEGFGTYAQALYVEHLYGREGYHRQMAGYRRGHKNRGPVAPRRTMDTQEVYFGPRGDSPGNDIYYKGACVLHTLRWFLGDEAMATILRRMAYPDPALEERTDGSPCRFSSTEEFLAIAEEHSGRELGWFFEVYLRQPTPPRLESEVRDGVLYLAWKVPDDLPFPMPVEVCVEGELLRVPMEGGRGSVTLGGRAFEIDPHDWILKLP